MTVYNTPAITEENILAIKLKDYGIEGLYENDDYTEGISTDDEEDDVRMITQDAIKVYSINDIANIVYPYTSLTHNVLIKRGHLLNTLTSIQQHTKAATTYELMCQLARATKFNFKLYEYNPETKELSTYPWIKPYEEKYKDWSFHAARIYNHYFRYEILHIPHELVYMNHPGDDVYLQAYFQIIGLAGLCGHNEYTVTDTISSLELLHKMLELGISNIKMNSFGRIMCNEMNKFIHGIPNECMKSILDYAELNLGQYRNHNL